MKIGLTCPSTSGHTRTHSQTRTHSPFHSHKCHLFICPTLEETFDAEVGNCEAKHRQLVQLGDDIRGEWQQAGQPVQLSIQPVPVPLRRVCLLTGSGRLPGDEPERNIRVFFLVFF